MVSSVPLRIDAPAGRSARVGTQLVQPFRGNVSYVVARQKSLASSPGFRLITSAGSSDVDHSAPIATCAPNAGTPSERLFGAAGMIRWSHWLTSTKNGLVSSQKPANGAEWAVAVRARAE